MSDSRRPAVPGIVLVALAASMWGSDAILRRFLAVGEISASVIVMLEHVLLTIVFLPALLKVRPVISRLDAKDWASLVLIGGGASILATTLFTQAFAYGDFIAPALLQKLQPVFAILLAALLLGERLMRRYWIFFVGAVAGAWLISFPGQTKALLTGGEVSFAVQESEAALFALGAAALWGMGTVLGRRLTPKIPFARLTALRFAIGLPIGVLVVVLQGRMGEVTTLAWEQWWAVLWLALIPGGAGLLVYYRGLGRTSASAATIGELAFPLMALVYGWFFVGNEIDGYVLTGVAVLIGVIVAMGLAQARRRNEGIGVVAPEQSEPALAEV